MATITTTSTLPIKCQYTFQPTDPLFFITECPACHRKIKSLKVTPGSFTATISHEGVSIEKPSFTWPQLTISSTKFNELRPQGEKGKSTENWRFEFTIEDSPLFILVHAYIMIKDIQFNQKDVPEYTFYIEFHDKETATAVCNYFQQKGFKTDLAVEDSSTEGHFITAYIDTTDKERFFTEFNEFRSKATMTPADQLRMEVELREIESNYNFWKRCYDKLQPRI